MGRVLSGDHHPPDETENIVWATSQYGAASWGIRAPDSPDRGQPLPQSRFRLSRVNAHLCTKAARVWTRGRWIVGVLRRPAVYLT